jgi:hypothetical protein
VFDCFFNLGRFVCCRDLRAGELVLIPRGGEREVVHSPRGKAIQLETFLAKRAGVIDTDPEAVILICGQFNIDRHPALRALRALPRAVSLRVGTEPGSSPLARNFSASVGEPHVQLNIYRSIGQTPRAPTEPGRLSEQPQTPWNHPRLSRDQARERPQHDRFGRKGATIRCR